MDGLDERLVYEAIEVDVIGVRVGAQEEEAAVEAVEAASWGSHGHAAGAAVVGGRRNGDEEGATLAVATDPNPPPTRRFRLRKEGFMLVRRGDSRAGGALDGYPWFSCASSVPVAASEKADAAALWHTGGLRDVLARVLEEELGAPVVRLATLSEDLDAHRERYDEVYHKFLDRHGKAHGLESHDARAWFLADRDQDLRNSSCMERVGHAAVARPAHAAALIELGRAAPPEVEPCEVFNRRCEPLIGRGLHRGAVPTAHIDMVVEGALSHLKLAQEVGEVVQEPGSPHSLRPRRALRREMLQCWVALDEVTCMPLALYLPNEGAPAVGAAAASAPPRAVVPELRPRDLVLWRTASTLHGAFPAAAHGAVVVALEPGAPAALGAVLCAESATEPAIVVKVDRGGAAAAAGLRPGDVLAEVDGRRLPVGEPPVSALSAAQRRCLRDGRRLEMAFHTPRPLRRRSVEFRFFAYWRDDGS